MRLFKLALRLPSLFVCLAIVGGFAGCGKSGVAPTAGTDAPQVYHVRGVLKAINFASQTVTVQHEAIPDYMPSMTMPFDVKSMEEVQPFSAGDAIGFDLVVTEKSSWIQNVRKTAATELQLPDNKAANASAIAPIGGRLKEGDPVPEFSLTDHRGDRVTWETVGGRPLLLTFIFTRCPIPNFCPLMSQNFQRVQALLAKSGDQSLTPQYLSISFDPEFDTGEVLAQYASRYIREGVDWRFASGTPEEIEKLTRAFSVYIQPESGTISHGLCTALVGPDGTIRKLWRGNSWDPAEVIAALKSIDGNLSSHAAAVSLK